MNFFSNLAAAFWMLLGSTRAFTLIKPTFGQFVLFLLLAVSANVLFAHLAAPSGALFNEQGLISYLVWPTLIVIAGIILAKRSINYSLLFVPAILWLAADGLLVLVQSGIQFLENKGWLPQMLHGVLPTLFALLFVWQMVALLWIFAKRLRWSWLERGFVLFATIILLVVWQKNIADQPIFKARVQPIELNEAQFYQQPQVFAQALDSVQRGEAGKVDWYFLGAASFADQSVFMSEILQAKYLFDEQFGTKSRSLALINNPQTWADFPIATRTSIERALRVMGEQMNDDDVLVLTLSSHGTVDESGLPTGELAVVNEPLNLAQIDPLWLRSALDYSGIRWRVVIISACYSGQFIDALKDAHTLIITASRADRASFGCSDDADLTYFGRAFFEESLPTATSFETAFAKASDSVREREAAMGFEPSEPQLWMGEQMREALPRLEASLFGRTKPKDAKTPVADAD